MIINHNIAAMNTHRQLGSNNASASKNLEKLSSGLKINRAGDDAAGLAISEKMRAQIRGLDMAQKNSQDGISLIQTAEGALNETHSILQRMRELAVQAGNDTNVESDRGEIQKELNQLTSEINRIGNTTEFNTKKLTNGELSATSKVSGGKVTSVTVDANFKPAYAKGVTTTSGGVNFKDNQIKISASDDFPWANLANSGGTLTVSKNASGNIQVDIAGVKDASGNALAISGDTLTADADGNLSFDAHGISFTISAEDATNMKATGKVEVNLFAAGANKSGGAVIPTKSDFTQTVGTSGQVAAAFGSGGITFKDANVASVKIDYAGGSGGIGAANVFTLTLTNLDGTTTTEVITQASGAGNEVLDYKGHGIEFKLDTKDATVVSYELNQAKGLEKVDKAETKDNSAQFQIGANEHQSMSVGINDMRAEALGITTVGTDAKLGVTDGTNNTVKEQALDVSSHKNAAAAVTVINAAIEKVSAERSKLGAVQNRLEHTINNLGTSSENLTAAESRIRDVDMAKEMMDFTKNNILTQAAQAMLAQANQQPQGVLQLLR